MSDNIKDSLNIKRIKQEEWKFCERDEDSGFIGYPAPYIDPRSKKKVDFYRWIDCGYPEIARWILEAIKEKQKRELET